MDAHFAELPNVRYVPKRQQGYLTLRCCREIMRNMRVTLIA